MFFDFFRKKVPTVNHYFSRGSCGLEANGSVFDADILQSRDDSCAVHSQFLILKDFGYQGDEAQLLNEATRNGWYIPGEGTPIKHMGKLLASNGVPCDVYHGANEHDLVNALAHGRRVMVAVDSSELHNNSELWRFFENQKDLYCPNPNHALLVSGIDTSDAFDPKVILTDPGTGQVAAPYPLSTFLDSWQDSNFLMVVTRDAAPFDFNPVAMANFNYEQGTIPYFDDHMDFMNWLSHSGNDISSFSDTSGAMPVDRAFADLIRHVDFEDVAAGTNVALQSLDLSGFDLSDCELPQVDLASLDMSNVPIDVDADTIGEIFSSFFDDPS